MSLVKSNLRRSRRCPRCGDLMWRRSFDGVQVDGCGTCGGTWFDARELEQLVRLTNVNLQDVERGFAAGMNVPLATKGTGRCPVCDKPLIPFHHPKLKGIKLDGCPSCRGVWADEGELIAIQRALSPSTSAAGGQAQPQAAKDLTDTRNLPITRGYHIPAFRHPTGILDRLKTGVAFIRSAYALSVENAAFLVPLFWGGAVNLALFILLLAVLWEWSGATSWETFSDWLDANEPSLTVVGAVWLAMGLMVSYYFKGVTVSMVDAHLKGRAPSLRIAFRDASKNVAGITMLAIASTVVSLLLSALRRRSRDRGGIISWGDETAINVMQATWEVITYLVLPIIIIEDVGFFAALGRAKELHRRNLLQIALGEIGINMAARLISFFAVAFGAMIVWGGSLLGWAGLIGGTVSAVALFAFVSALTAFAKAAYYTCLYLWAAELERAKLPETVLVPAPLAAALT